MELIQRILFSLADTMDVWRDVAIIGLAVLVIACLWLAVDTIP